MLFCHIQCQLKFNVTQGINHLPNVYWFILGLGFWVASKFYL
jgi:hypothetical protein